MEGTTTGISNERSARHFLSKVDRYRGKIGRQPDRTPRTINQKPTPADRDLGVYRCPWPTTEWGISSVATETRTLTNVWACTKIRRSKFDCTFDAIRRERGDNARSSLFRRARHTNEWTLRPNVERRTTRMTKTPVSGKIRSRTRKTRFRINERFPRARKSTVLRQRPGMRSDAFSQNGTLRRNYRSRERQKCRAVTIDRCKTTTIT